MVDNISIKVVLKDKEAEDELRRFVVDKEVSTSISYLQEKLCLVFPQLKQKIFSVTWSDEDGDKVTIATDEELIIALTEMSGPVYKLIIDVKSTKKTTKETQIHHGITCDACEKTPIEGNRYKCVVCDDLDLCESCEAAGRHPGHNMIRISNTEMASPQRLFKRIHKMQDRAEKHHSQQKKENGESARASPPMFGCPRDRHGIFYGRGMHGFGGMTRAGDMRGGFVRMGGMRGGCSAGAWAGPAFEAMMKGYMGEPQLENQGKKAESNTDNEKQEAHAAAAHEAHNKTNTANGAASSSDEAAMKAAFEQSTTMTRSPEYLKNVGNFVAAALEPFGIDVQVNIETPGASSNRAKSQSSSSDVEEGKEPEQEDAEKMQISGHRKGPRPSTNTTY